MGRMLSMIFSPVIFFPSLEITAEIAQPDGMRTWPSSCFIPIRFLSENKKAASI